MLTKKALMPALEEIEIPFFGFICWMSVGYLFLPGNFRNLLLTLV